MTGLEPLIPISFVLTVGSVFLARGPLGHALADQLRGGPSSKAIAGELEQLHRDIDELRQHLVETQERLDFAERLLASGDQPPAAPRRG
jgi:hypothetical protein